VSSFAIKNWDQYQHYRDRRPPWIKLHVEILNDVDFAKLDRSARGLLLQLEALAAKSDGSLLYNQEVISFGLRLNDFQLDELNPLFESGFLIPDEECKRLLEDARICVRSPLLCSSSSLKTKRRRKEPEEVRDAPPSPEEVQAFLDEIGEKRFTGEEFCAAGERDGWMTGKGHARKPMVSWRGGVRTWRTSRDRWDRENNTPVFSDEDRRAALAAGAKVRA
jgi:hypothetical protein